MSFTTLLIELLMLLFVNVLLVIAVYLGYTIGEQERKLDRVQNDSSRKHIDELCEKYNVIVSKSWSDRVKELFVKDL